MRGGWVYMVTNRPNGTLYIGVTSNLSRRVWEHRKGEVEGFTRRYRLKRLVWAEYHEDIRAAIQREKNIKHWSRAWKGRPHHRADPRMGRYLRTTRLNPEMAGSSPAMTEVVLATRKMRSRLRPSLLGPDFGPGFRLLLGGFARRSRVGLGEHAADRAAQNPHPHTLGDIDGDFLGVVHAGDGSDDPAACNDPIAAPQRVEHCPLVFRLTLLRTDQEKIEYDKDQDKRQKLNERVLIKYARSLGVGGRNQHWNHAP